MATRPTETSDIRLERATGRPWPHWRALLDDWGASGLDHKTIARRLNQEANVDGWWAQTLTVRYEREIGRRRPGQGCSGDYEVGVSATRSGDMDALLAAWRNAHDGRTEADGVSFDGPPRVSASQKWRYWKRDLEDGSRVTVNICAKSDTKSLIQVQHAKLARAEAMERWRALWRGELSALT